MLYFSRRFLSPTSRPWVQRGLLWSLVVGALVMGAGCSASQSTAAPPAAAGGADPAPITADNPLSSDLGQQLPITAVTTLGGQEIFLEVATTPQQQSLGLMYREALPDDRGMLFPMGQPRPVSFWMKNVPVPLDMVFIYDGTIQAIAAAVPPCTAEPCPTYGPGPQPIDQVIELRAGRAAELGLAVGDEVVVRPLEP
jgi:uncharacterized protein